MTLQPEGNMDVNVTIGEKGYQKHFEKLPAIFPTDEGTLAFFQDVDSVTLQDGTKVPRMEKNVRHMIRTKLLRKQLSLLMNVLVLFQKNWEVQKRIWKPLSVTRVSRT